jgi:hypothetical protein
MPEGLILSTFDIDALRIHLFQPLGPSAICALLARRRLAPPALTPGTMQCA